MGLGIYWRIFKVKNVKLRCTSETAPLQEVFFVRWHLPVSIWNSQGANRCACQKSKRRPLLAEAVEHCGTSAKKALLRFLLKGA